MTAHSISSIFDLHEKDKPLCFGCYVHGSYECGVCSWLKECQEGENPEEGP